jgi:hypothetical protein
MTRQPYILRVSETDRKLILAGLGFIAANRELQLSKGSLPNARMEAVGQQWTIRKEFLARFPKER